MNNRTFITNWETHYAIPQRKLDKDISNYLVHLLDEECMAYADQLLADWIGNDEEEHRSYEEFGDQALQMARKALYKDYSNHSPDYKKTLYNLLVSKTALTSEDRQKLREVMMDRYTKMKRSYKSFNHSKKNTHGANAYTLSITRHIGNTKAAMPDTIRIDPNNLDKILYNYLDLYAKRLDYTKPKDLDKLRETNFKGLAAEIESRAAYSLYKSKEFVQDLTEFIEAAYLQQNQAFVAYPKEILSQGKAPFDYGYKVYDSNNKLLLQMNFDDKSNTVGIGTTRNNYPIVDLDQILNINPMSSYATFGLHLTKYNASTPSSQNEVLLQYLYDEYHDCPNYYIIDHGKQEVCSLTHMVDNDMLYLDPAGLQVIQMYADPSGTMDGMVRYAKGQVK